MRAGFSSLLPLVLPMLHYTPPPQLSPLPLTPSFILFCWKPELKLRNLNYWRKCIATLSATVAFWRVWSISYACFHNKASLNFVFIVLFLVGRHKSFVVCSFLLICFTGRLVCASGFACTRMIWNVTKNSYHSCIVILFTCVLLSETIQGSTTLFFLYISLCGFLFKLQKALLIFIPGCKCSPFHQSLSEAQQMFCLI